MFKTPLVSFQFASHFASRFVCRFALRFCADFDSKSGANLIAIPHKLGFNFARFLLSFCTKLSTHVVLWVHRFAAFWPSPLVAQRSPILRRRHLIKPLFQPLQPQTEALTSIRAGCEVRVIARDKSYHWVVRNHIAYGLYGLSKIESCTGNLLYLHL